MEPESMQLETLINPVATLTATAIVRNLSPLLQKKDWLVPVVVSPIISAATAGVGMIAGNKTSLLVQFLVGLLSTVIHQVGKQVKRR